MRDFLRRLYQLRKQKITLILWENGNPDDPESFNLKPQSILRLGLFVGFLWVAFFSLLIVLTPIGTILSDHSNSNFRNDLMAISTRVLELQDSLQVRDVQLDNMREVLRTSPDTVFSVGMVREGLPANLAVQSNYPVTTVSFNSNDFIRVPDVNFDAVIPDAPVFPVTLPVSGSIISNFQPEVGHFGIDVAATIGTPFRNIADGVVINTDWTINYGHIIHIQHGDGYLSIFKHSSAPLRKTGEVIRKGDILGNVSDSGIISTGPHLHFELWRNGRPLNPMNYIIN
ncbi:MAG: M23 family metallopeptidase [Balneolales bacterium]|nr:M23 family metallopeptidase [Balneolales bacterium]